MKILELRLTAFGSFTDRTLDLGAGHEGLHVIFGPNEAGKSSALRALHALLYGIHPQTEDDFQHPYNKLRIGACLRLSNGETIEFSRRKANKGSLTGADDEKLPDGALDRFLGGVSADQFRMFWGIDHARLVQGGREILEGHGDLGEALFSAGTGAARLGALRRKLETESESLFLPQGRNPSINQGLAKLRALRAEQGAETISADQWVRLEKQAREAEDDFVAGMARWREMSQQKSRLERLRRVGPILAERDELRSRLNSYGDVVLLPSDFSTRRLEAQTTASVARDQCERLEQLALEQKKILDALGATPRLVQAGESSEKLYQALGMFRKGAADRPRLVGRRAELRSLAERHVRQLRPDLDLDGVEDLRVFLGRRSRLLTLAQERARLEARLETARERLSLARKQSVVLAQEATRLPAARNADRLLASMAEASKRGNAEEELVLLRSTVASEAEQRDAAARRLAIPEDLVDGVAELAVPSLGTVTAFERQEQELETQIRSATIEVERLRKQGDELRRKIETLRVNRSVPTETDLVEARQRRDATFELLRQQWVERRDVTSAARDLVGDGPLIELYPLAVSDADRIADRLRNEADRVAELAKSLEDLETRQKEATDAEQALARWQKLRDELLAEWRGLWPSALSRTPAIRDGIAWCQEFSRLMERSNAVAEARRRSDDLAHWIAQQIASLRTTIESLDPVPPSSDGLAFTLAVAEQLRSRLSSEENQRLEHARREAENFKELSVAEDDRVATHAAVEVWEGTWGDAVRGLLANRLPTPNEALEVIDRLDDVFKALEEAAKLEERIAGIDRDAEDFARDARALAGVLEEATSLEAGQEEAWVESLQRRISHAQTEEEQRRQARRRLAQLEDEIETETRTLTAARSLLDRLREEARCESDEALVLAEQRSEQVLRLRNDLDRVELNLLHVGDGATLAELEAEAAETGRDLVEEQLGAIHVELPAVERHLEDVRERRSEAQAALRRLHGESAAAQKAEEAQAMVARLRDDALQYARLRIASTLLVRRIEDYRRSNQAPLLRRASELFRAMTLQRFDRLEADVEEDRPILLGVRSDGTRVGPSGMSEGTRDQLFFALRLAAVEASCRSGEPMPFIVDDVLVQFDDERSAATLRVLGELAAYTQVVLFTHHQHLRASAETLVVPAGVILHDL